MNRETRSHELYLRLLGHVRPYWRMFGAAILAMVLSASTEPLFPALMKPLLDKGFGPQRSPLIMWAPVAIVLLFLVRGVLSFASGYCMNWVANKVITDLRNLMFRRLVMLPTTFFEDRSSGVLMSKIAYDASGVTTAATGTLTTLVRDGVTVLGLLGWLVYLNWQLTLVTLLIVPGIALVVSKSSNRLRNMSRGVQRSMGELSHVIEEGIECHKVIKVFGGQEHEIARFEKTNSALRGYQMRHAIAAAAAVPITQMFISIAMAIVIAIALNQAAAEQATVGGFVSFITAMLMLIAPLKHLTEINAPLQRGLAAAESVFELLDEAPEVDSGTIDIGRVRGEIEFQAVRFRYPTGTRPALDGVSFLVRAGETVALVGASGSGKTTIANLIPRFYGASEGGILIDGTNVAEARLGALRANIALVSQDVVLFNDTVAANIAYGSAAGQAGEERIVEAARAAHAWEFIQQLPQGLKTEVGENGVKLSGGQRQRLAIARAFLKNAPILILDEATSALDTESERRVQEALETLMRGRTTLVIAHRLSTIENAHRIFVLQQGRIVESGSHAELLARNGAYASLYRVQLAGEEPALAD